MKPEEAIEIVNGNFINATLEENETHSDAFERAFKMAKAALEKQIPKKPSGDYHSVPHYRCPNCNREVVLYEISAKYPYCKYCGQAIDWSGQE